MTNAIIQALIRREWTPEEAAEIWEEMLEAVNEYGENPEEVLDEYDIPYIYALALMD